MKSPLLDGGGEMGALIREYDWSTTSLGSIGDWPVSLRVQVSMMLASRFPMLIFWGSDLITFYNDAFRPSLGVDGKHPGSLGQKGEHSWSESWPVIGPMIYDIMDGGEAVWFEDQKLPLYRDGKMGYAYWTYSFSPIVEDAGRVNGILVTCSETTKAVEAVNQLQSTNAALRNAVELAELGTFSVDLTTGLLTTSQRVADWFGFEQLTADTDAFINGVGPEERDYVRTSLYNTLLPASDGRYNVVHSVINAQTGQQRILHALGQVFFDAAGTPLKIEGTAQDITAQRELQLVLEQQVQERTEELDAANEELAASNEELLTSYEEMATANVQLNEANHLLNLSNDNLQQFAYIASHDLQEPLRKVQSFGTLLQMQYGPQLGEGVNYILRMQVAAKRMSALIQDLLAFSRLAIPPDIEQSTDLNEVVDIVLTDLEMLTSESESVVEVASLPTVWGDARQLGQLFQNLLSNAIKFRRPDTPPLIQIRSSEVNQFDLPIEVKPTRQARSYYRIDIADNGIGFEAQYAHRIFQVFQRLHGKEQYTGTGIGLAICEKVVANCGGAITATSQLGEGATFSVYLPASLG